VKAGPDGGSIWVARDQLGKDAPADGQQPGGTAPPEKVKVGEYELSANDVAMLMQQKAAADLKATQIPADASGYEPKLPEGLKLPEGIEFKVDPTEPGFEDLRQIAKKLNWSQAEFSDVLGVYAASQASKEATWQAAVRAELAKMGPNAAQRVTAIETWIRGMIGDEFGTPLRAMIVSERQAVAFEKLIHKFASQGSASFRQDGREPAGAPGRVSEAEYNAMSQAERYNYAKGFDQKQFRN
jgi:hypothetical protein